MNENGCSCTLCNSLYKIDIIIPNEIWDRFSGGRKLMLCPICIMKLIIDTNTGFAAYKLTEIP